MMKAKTTKEVRNNGESNHKSKLTALEEILAALCTIMTERMLMIWYSKREM
jgi:hypothetical protein